MIERLYNIWVTVRDIIKKLIYNKSQPVTNSSNDEKNIEVIPENCSPVRYIVSQAQGQPYRTSFPCSYKV